MSRIYTILNELPKKNNLNGPENSTKASKPVPKKPLHAVFLILSTITAAVMLLFLGNLFHSVTAIKNHVYLSMDAKIRQQQSQISRLTKMLNGVQSSLEGRFTYDEAALKNLNDNTITQQSQTNVNLNRMEAALQANIDELNSKLIKLQILLTAFSQSSDHTVAVKSN